MTALAVDLGSASGRITAGTLRGGRVEQVEVHRFAHEPLLVGDALVWDLDRIEQEIVSGLRAAVTRFPEARSVSVDTWGVDFVALDADGARVGPARCYRDPRTQRTHQAFRDRLPDEQVFALTGIAPATINSANQMFALLTEEPDLARDIHQVLFLPDYLTHLLSGQRCYSPSHVSTSALCQPGGQQWCAEVFDALGIPRTWVGEIQPEHSVVGPCTVPGLEQLTVVRAGAHDTACAVHALQRGEGGETYFLSCGSWSVLGVLRDEPLMAEDARRLGLTNEARADHGVRPLFNITGLWILQECQREWAAAGEVADIAALVHAARQAPSPGPLINPDDPGYAGKGSMVQRLAADVAAQGGPVELSQGQAVRVILESLAARYARGVADLEALTGAAPAQLTMTGGGSLNILLCDLTADALGVPVVAGPAEASTLGSLLAQFEVLGDLDPAGRDTVIAASAHTTRHEPR